MPWSHIAPPTRTIYIVDDPAGRRCSFRTWPEGPPGARSTAIIETPRLSSITDDGERLWVGHLAPGLPEEIEAHLALELAETGEYGFRVVPPGTPNGPPQL